MSPRTNVFEFARAHLGKRFLFYAGVSGVATLITQVVLAVGHGLLGWRASIANIIAVAVATPVSYYMNRAWVWKKRGKSHFRKEVAPFWAFSIGGMLLSTFLVGLVALTQHVPTGVRPTAFQQLQINLANVVGFGILWLVQFFVLDKISFKSLHQLVVEDDGTNADPLIVAGNQSNGGEQAASSGLTGTPGPT